MSFSTFRGRRLSHMLRRPPSPNPDDSSAVTVSDQTFNNESCLQAGPALRPRMESSPAVVASSFSSSFKTPARSYYQRPIDGSLAPLESIQSASGSVRQDTAELASRALFDTGSGSPRYSITAIPGRFAQLSDAVTQASSSVQRKSVSSTIPGVGHGEADGSSTRQSLSTATGQGQSALSDLIRNSPPGDESDDSHDVGRQDGMDFGTVTVGQAIISQPRETTPLLSGGSDGGKYDSYGSKIKRDIESLSHLPEGRLADLGHAVQRSTGRGREIFQILITPKSWDGKTLWTHGVVKPVSYLPAVLLGLLLNILDALSYGMILFPLGQPIFASLGPDGISMFYVSCIISQLVYSCGGSVFRGGIGSEMIEVVPFFHKMAFTIMAQVGEDKPRTVVATTILSYAISSVLTGLVFFLMGTCKLGVLIGFFPRHILIGCIGGVGFFLVLTGLEVSARMDGSLEFTLGSLKKLIEPDTIPLWTIPLALAITLTIVKRWIKHSLTDAAWFVSIIIIFYIIVAAVPNLNLDDLRSTGWVFEAPEANVPWYHFYTLYDFGAVDWNALGQTVPAMFALTFFGILHVPINIPALGLSTGEDNVDVDRELKAHGYSNALSGVAGSIQNYLVYTNTLLFMRSGGDSRFAGVLLAIATFGILVIGPATIGFIPVMVVGTLIFFLGIDLMKEALVDTVRRVHRLEYITILIIVVTMGVYDFVVGILVGIVLACFSYVLQTSRISAIRGTLPGGIASSTVRRHPIQHEFLQEVGRQISVMKLAGYLFFGTIVGVENSIRKTLDDDVFESQPIRFLIIDLSKVDGVDFSAAEAFTRINRLLNVRGVRMVLSGFASKVVVGDSLRNVGLIGSGDGVDFFEGLNSALEYCENELLKAFYQRRAAMLQHVTSSQHLDVPSPPRKSFPDEASFSSPRRDQLHAAANATLQEEQTSRKRNWHRYEQPLQLILQTLSGLSNKDEIFWRRSVPYFVRRDFIAGTVLYSSGDPPNGFYLLETGILKAKYRLPQGTFSEVIVAGATCGELPFFSETDRTATTFAERDAVAWVLDRDHWEQMQQESREVAQELLKISLKLTSERMDAITKYMLLNGT